MGSNAVAHLFEELLAGILAPTAIISVISAFHVIRRTKETHEVLTDAMGSVALSGVGYGSGLISEVALDRVLDTMLGPTSAGIGIASRIVVKKSVQSRLQTALSIKRQAESLDMHVKSLPLAG